CYLFQDHIPSVVEINLAIERVLAEEHLKNNPNISLHYNGIKMMSSIPEFRVPPYLIDFGLVIVDTEVHQNVTLTNHGPGLVMINLCKPDRKNSFKNLGFEVVFKNIVDLPVGGFVTLFVKFLPLRRRYQTQQTNVDVTAWLEVSS
ncbi:unnamed protein product, partial [Timema podura]|nr:unnamed protein product [Timema podura]